MLIWLHDEALRADHPVFASAPDARAVFVWDDALFTDMEYGFKKLVFIYEALTELPVDIIKGSTVSVLRDLASGEEIHTPTTSNPHLAKIMVDLGRDHTVTKVADDPFVRLNATPDLKRFFRYWNKAKKSAMQSHGGMADLFEG